MAETSTTKIGRNDACPCDSGRKYKRCCLRLGDKDPYRRAPQQAPTAFEEKPRSWMLADWPNHRTSFFAPAAAAVAEGHDLPDYVVPAWVRAQVRNRLRIAGGFAEVCLRKVRALETSEILTQLAAFGIELNENSFTASAEPYSSAWEFAEAFSDQHKRKDAEWVGLAFCELWVRKMNRPSLEMLDEQMQDGYDFVEDGELHRAAETWLSVASELIGLMPKRTRSMKQVDAWFPGLSSVANWHLDLEEVLHEVGRENESVASAGAAMHLRWATKFKGDEEFSVAARRAYADLLFLSGKQPEAEVELSALITQYPTDAGAYVMLADIWSRGLQANKADQKRALDLLRQALGVPVLEAKAWSIDKRMKELADLAQAAS